MLRYPEETGPKRRDAGRRTRKRGAWRTLGAFLVVCLAVLGAQAQPVPELVPYQGRVYLPDGSSNIEGTYDIEFRLYADTAADAPTLWAERHTGVPVAQGAFSVLLGAGSAIDANPHGAVSEAIKTDEIYIGTEVAGTEGAVVRRRFVAAAHAFHAQNALKAVHGVPPGTVMPFAGSAAPYGWLLCDGASYARADYAELFAAIGVTWGEGANPSETFNVPNFGGRLLAGANQDTVSEHFARRAGEEQHLLTAAEMPRHKHDYNDKSYDGAAYVFGWWIWGLMTVADDNEAFSSRTTDATGGGQAHANIQPSAAVTYIIKW